ncbi:MAG: porin [Fimbriimonadaceae bacterium]|nr:porin [Fimbriimonadaceae bacterium]
MRLQIIAIAAVCTVACAHGQESESPWKISGFVDGYWGNSSPDQGKGLTRFGRQFDVRNEQIRLANAQLTFVYTHPSGGYGFTFSPFIGDNTKILFATDPSDSGLIKHLAQGFATINEKRSGLSLDLGKFYSWIGYEGAESLDDDLYSRGFLYTLAQPAYHTGGRLTIPMNDQWGASLFATQGWNQSESTGEGLTLGGQIRYTPNDKSFLSVGVISGKEGDGTTNRSGSFGGIGFGSTGRAQTDLVDVVYTYQYSPKLKLALNADVASVDGAGKDGQWSGWAGHARYEASDKVSVALRIESVADRDGLRLGVPATVGSFSLGADYRLNPLFTLRAEYRKDWADTALFTNTSGTSKNQSTFNVGFGVRF